MELDVNNFETFSREEYQTKLNDLGIDNFNDLVGKEVYYSKKSYGIHKVIEWDSNDGEYLLALEGQRFWTNPFRIKQIEKY